MQNPLKSQFFVRDRAVQHSRLRSAGHTKCDCALRAQKNTSCLKTLKKILCANSSVLAINVRVCDATLKQVVMKNTCAAFERFVCLKT